MSAAASAVVDRAVADADSHCRCRRHCSGGLQQTVKAARTINWVEVEGSAGTAPVTQPVAVGGDTVSVIGVQRTERMGQAGQAGQAQCVRPQHLQFASVAVGDAGVIAVSHPFRVAVNHRHSDTVIHIFDSTFLSLF